MSKLNGGIIGPDNVPTGAFGSASGVWSLSDVTNYKKQGTWPVVLTGHQVANSCRFNSGSSDYLNRTFSTGNRRTFTYSGWCKRPPEEETAFLTVGSGTTRSYIFITSSKLTVQNEVSSSVTTNLQTNAVYRDSSAWMHIVVAVDTTQGTEANRIKIYVNGEQITSFGTSNYPSQNEDFSFNNNIVHEIGRTPWNNGNLYDGYFCEIVWIDGLQLTPTSFGETDSVTNNWVPKDVSGLTFGTNGFYLDFKDSSALGNDANGSNNFTVNNLTSIDQSTDTCTNNFATWNPLENYYQSNTYSEGNLQVQTQNTSFTYNFATIGVSTGKWYWEVEYDAKSGGTDQPFVGITSTQPTSNDHELGNFPNDFAWYTDNGTGYLSNNNTYSNVGFNAYTVGDVISVALDLDNNKLYFAKNGTWEKSGNPESGSTGTGAISITATASTPLGAYFPSVADGTTSYNATFKTNFGSPPYAISSGNTDSSGMGNFEYAVPEGYYSLCTRNLNLIG